MPKKMTEKQRMLAGKLYRFAGDAELMHEFQRARKITRQYNSTTENQQELRSELLHELFGAIGESPYIEPPFRCDYGGNIFIGKYFYANFDCIILDICNVTIGDNVMFGPRVQILTAAHPVDADVRNSGLEFGKPITIGDSVWIGGNAIVNPGVTIGARTIIGSGAVVTKNIPADVIAAGNPCKILRPISEKDRQYWNELRQEYERENMP